MFTRGISDASRYHRQLDRLVARARGRRVAALEHDGVLFRQMLDDRERLVPLLVRSVVDGSYRPTALSLTTTTIGEKTRDIARASAIELVVNGVIAEVLAEITEPLLSPNVYSYRRGRSSWQAVRWLARVARDHVRRRPNPKARGLYVLRSDVTSYTDSIPTGDDAVLWKDLAPHVGERHTAMVRALLRAPGRDRGVLFGLPTTNVIGNLYLTPLDAALSERGGYARFGDDVSFVDEDPARVREAQATLERVLAERGLTANTEKLRIFFWNGAPRASLTWPETTPTRTIPFLGAAVRFDGTVALVRAKLRVLLGDLRARILRTAALLEGETREKKALALARIVNDAFDPRSSLALDHAPMTLDLVSDRAQLAELDYLFALWIAEAVSGRTGPRAFREVPYRWLREEAKLRSRVVARNRGRAQTLPRVTSRLSSRPSSR